MKKKLISRILIIIAIVFAAAFSAAVIIPLFISPSPLEGLVTVKEIKRPESRFINIPFEGTDGISIHYREEGTSEKGDPVFILLHGSMYNLFSWDRVIDELSTRGRVIAYDQVPYGLSGKLAEGDWSGRNPYTQEAAVDQLIALLDALDLDMVYLIGSSYGGTLAVRAAIEHKERIAGMILVDAAVFVNETMPAWLLDSRQMENIGHLFARMMGNNVAFYESCYADPDFFQGERKEDTMIMTEVENWDRSLWKYLKAWGTETFDFTPRIQEIDVSVLVISGSEDAIVPPEDSVMLDKLLPRSTLEIISGAGHMPHEEAPKQFIEIALSWIDELTDKEASR